MMASGSAPARVTTRAQLAELLENAEAKYAEVQTAYADADAQKSDQAKYDEAIAMAETVEDMAIQLMKNYITAKKRLKFLDNLNDYVVPVGNVLHTLWNGVDIIMNQELVSTTNQKYMYKAYIESVLNNSASTKKYQLETQGFYGDQGDKDQDFRQTFNPGMTKRYMKFNDDKTVQLMGFLHLDIMGIQGSIVNGSTYCPTKITFECRLLDKIHMVDQNLMMLYCTYVNEFRCIQWTQKQKFSQISRL